jgi:hypothetical protein
MKYQTVSRVEKSIDNQTIVSEESAGEAQALLNGNHTAEFDDELIEKVIHLSTLEIVG